VQLVAAAQPLDLQDTPLLEVLLNSPLRLLGPAATPGTLPPPPAPIQFAIAPNLANTIDAVYIAVEPWVQYGFEVATAVVRWVPYVGWFAGLIMDGYFFGESLVASAVFNFTDFLRGDGGIAENVVDFGIDVGLAFVWLGLDALNTFIPLPPFCCYPPRPPVQGPFLAAEIVETEAADTGEQVTANTIDDSEEKQDPEGLDDQQGLTDELPGQESAKDAVDEISEEELTEGSEDEITDGSDEETGTDEVADIDGTVDQGEGATNVDGETATLDSPPPVDAGTPTSGTQTPQSAQPGADDPGTV
jgi:hypothetical protein